MKSLLITAVVVQLLFTPAFVARANELSGYIESEVQYFPNHALHPGQRENTASIAIQPEYYHEWENNLSIVIVPFVRLDSADSERTHFDIRELNLLWVGDSFEFRLGANKVFWGVTEFVHLADIINQNDAVESVDGEEKLSQPMAHVSSPTESGTFDLFLLPWFRERTYPGVKGRLRSGWIVDTDHPRYESGAEESHLDFAVRYSHSLDNIDLGLYYFKGTNREPTLTPNPVNQTLTPYYQQISQTGIDLQLTTGHWLLKLEAIHRIGQGNSYFAVTTGFEYTITGIAQSRTDLGVIGEIVYDDRQDNATTVYENDIMFGFRLAFNDMAGSELLIGIIKDIDDSSTVITMEGSRRLGDNWKVSLEASLLSNIAENDLLYDLQEDDSIKLKLAYYF